MSEEIDLRQVKVATCQVCQGWVMAGCFPKSEEDDEAAREWRKCVKAGHKISVVLLTEWNTGPLSEVMCRGHKPEKVAPITKGKSPATVQNLMLIATQQEQIAKLQAFKDFVHTTLDAAGVDKHEEQNATTGCRVGARLRDVIEASTLASPVAQWVSVVDRLPTEPDTYFVYAGQYTNGDPVFFQAWCSILANESKPTFFSKGEAVSEITHWMPLPAIPVKLEGSKPNA